MRKVGAKKKLVCSVTRLGEPYVIPETLLFSFASKQIV